MYEDSRSTGGMVRGMMRRERMLGRSAPSESSIVGITDVLSRASGM